MRSWAKWVKSPQGDQGPAAPSAHPRVWIRRSPEIAWVLCGWPCSWVYVGTEARDTVLDSWSSRPGTQTDSLGLQKPEDRERQRTALCLERTLPNSFVKKQYREANCQFFWRWVGWKEGVKAKVQESSQYLWISNILLCIFIRVYDT